jgi:hypothetical protein
MTSVVLPVDGGVDAHPDREAGDHHESNGRHYILVSSDADAGTDLPGYKPH